MRKVLSSVSPTEGYQMADAGKNWTWDLRASCCQSEWMWLTRALKHKAISCVHSLAVKYLKSRLGSIFWAQYFPIFFFFFIGVFKWWNSFQEYDRSLWMGKKANATADCWPASRHSNHGDLRSPIMYRWQFWDHHPGSATKFIRENNSKWNVWSLGWFYAALQKECGLWGMIKDCRRKSKINVKWAFSLAWDTLGICGKHLLKTYMFEAFF